MDDVITALSILFGFIAVALLCCTFLNWNWWSSMRNSKWLDEMNEIDEDGGDLWTRN